MKVDEIFGPTIGGEGALAGAVTLFVRLGGCDYRCAWCDTMHAVDAANATHWREMDAGEIVTELRGLAPRHRHGIWVTISGGNPAIWRHELRDLVDELRAEGYRINIETQGSVANCAFLVADMVTVSPKGPSSGMVLVRDKLADVLGQAGERAVLKFVVGDESDLQFARDLSSIYPGLRTFAQPLTTGIEQGHAFPAYRWLCETVAQDPALRHWRVIPQLHVLAWGGERGR